MALPVTGEARDLWPPPPLPLLVLCALDSKWPPRAASPPLTCASLALCHPRHPASPAVPSQHPHAHTPVALPSREQCSRLLSAVPGVTTGPGRLPSEAGGEERGVEAPSAGHLWQNYLMGAVGGTVGGVPEALAQAWPLLGLCCLLLSTPFLAVPAPLRGPAAHTHPCPPMGRLQCHLSLVF